MLKKVFLLSSLFCTSSILFATTIKKKIKDRKASWQICKNTFRQQHRSLPATKDTDTFRDVSRQQSDAEESETTKTEQEFVSGIRLPYGIAPTPARDITFHIATGSDIKVFLLPLNMNEILFDDKKYVSAIQQHVYSDSTKNIEVVELVVVAACKIYSRNLLLWRLQNEKHLSIYNINLDWYYKANPTSMSSHRTAANTHAVDPDFALKVHAKINDFFQENPKLLVTAVYQEHLRTIQQSAK